MSAPVAARPTPLAPIFENFPADLCAIDHWVGWRLKWDADRKKPEGGSWTKVPVNVRTGRLADSTDPATWAPFTVAKAAYERGGLDGVGFVVTRDGGILAGDLDHCRDAATGEISPPARAIIAYCASYAEESPSREGIRIFVRGALPDPDAFTKKQGDVELYQWKRFMTVTGHRLPGSPEGVREVDGPELHRFMFGEAEKPAPKVTPAPRRTIRLADAEILEKARNAKGTGQAFGALFDRGDWAGLGHPSQSEGDLDLSGRLRFWFGADPAAIDHLFRSSAMYRDKWDSPRGTSTYGGWTIQKVIDGGGDVYSGPGQRVRVGTPSANGARPEPANASDDSATDGAPTMTVDCTVKDLPSIAHRAWAALLIANQPPRLFRVAGMPSRLEEDDEGAVVARPLSVDAMAHEVARAARFVVYRNLVETPIFPPAPVVRDMLAAPEPPLPPLRRIVESPVYAPDGSLSTEPGYHRAGRTYYHPAPGLTVPPVPEHPTSSDLASAKALLFEEVLPDFRFQVEKGVPVTEADRANAVALFLLPFARDLITGPTPLHSIEAATPGTGKGLLADVLLLPSIGQRVGVLPEATNDDEQRKRITARLIEARPAVLLDNVRQPLDSGVLAAALTATTWDDRILGKSASVSVPVRCVWVATGNNITYSTEILRRTVRIRLMADEERPWERTGFHHPDLREWAQKHRGDLAWAGLVIIRHWLAAGRPEWNGQPMGSFESYCRVIGGILDVAGIQGFLANRATFFEAADGETAAWHTLICAWRNHGVFSQRAITAGELFGVVQQIDGFPIGGSAAEQGQRVAFGKMLAQQRERVFAVNTGTEEKPKNETLRIASRGANRNHTTLWVLEPVTSVGSAGDAGDGGGYNPSLRAHARAADAPRMPYVNPGDGENPTQTPASPAGDDDDSEAKSPADISGLPIDDVEVF